MIWILLACWSPKEEAGSDAQRFAAATDPQSSLKQALAGCEEIQGEEARGDCLSVALSAHGASSREGCAGIASERWQGECYFLLAEKQRKQDLALATETCGLSSFARECMEHLVRSEAKLVVDADPISLQPTIAVLASSPVCEDAAVLFWQEWALLRVEADRMVGRRNCNGLEDEESCEKGMRRARKTLVQELTVEERCEAAKMGKPLLALQDGRAVLDAGAPVMPRGDVCGP